ncbi:MAG: acyltransferase family protein [Marinosulfonomonas sp.]
MKYRSDIDGLRTIAVLPVLFYHAGLGFPGGFVGVDVFFVISGYLITLLIASEISEGNFTILNFYERRARRIFPALFAMMAATLLAAAVIMIPVDLMDFGQSIMSTTLFAGNIWFYAQLGYFNEASELQPLLHTWSLGVEEQYYIVFPLLLIALNRYGALKRVFAWVLVLAIISFAAAVYTLPNDPDAAFYLPHLRAWELLIGSLLGLSVWRGIVRPFRTHLFVTNLLSLAGLVAIAWPVLAYGPETAFPGLAALPPCLGAALLIATGNNPDSIGAKLLSLRPMVFVGKLSYSLYLWHWPFISLAFYMVGPLSPALGVGCLIVSSFAAYLSWRYIEQPFRNKDTVGRRAIFASSIVGMASMLCVGLIFWQSSGFPKRMGPEFVQLAKPKFHVHNRKECYKITPTRAAAGDVCLRGAKEKAASFLLLGDSHADSLSPAIFAAAKQLKLSGYQYTGPGSVLFPGVYRLGKPHPQSVTALQKFLDERPSVKTLIITQFWLHIFTGYTYRHSGTIMADADYDGSGTAYNPTAIKHGLTRLAALFPDRKIILLDDIPTGRKMDIRSGLRLMRFNLVPVEGMPVSEYQAQKALYEPYLIEIANAVDNIEYWPFFDAVCNDEFCPLFDGDVLLYSNGDHISWKGALRLTDQAVDLLSTLPPGKSGS